MSREAPKLRRRGGAEPHQLRGARKPHGRTRAKRVERGGSVGFANRGGAEPHQLRRARKPHGRTRAKRVERGGSVGFANRGGAEPHSTATIDVRTIDWNRVWQARNSRRTSSKRDTGFWDTRAASFSGDRGNFGYADRFLSIMQPEPHWTVLDMGCGGGTLAIPLAKRVSSVTAVDISKEMLARVRARCEDEGITNVRTLEGRWEDDWTRAGIGISDVAIASRSMVVRDLRSALFKLDRAARRRVYVATIVGDGPFDRRLFEAIGRPLDTGCDYIYNYNMLYQMGILANVAFIEESRRKTYESFEEAYASVQWMFGALSPAEEERLRTYIREDILFADGSWQFSHDLVVRWAVMWWEKG